MNTYYRCTKQHGVASCQLTQLSSTTNDDILTVTRVHSLQQAWKFESTGSQVLFLPEK